MITSHSLNSTVFSRRVRPGETSRRAEFANREVSIAENNGTSIDVITVESATALKTNDITVSGVVPQAEYMYGCTATAVGMLLGYYDLNGYLGYDVSDLVDGVVEANARGTDGDAYDMDAFDTVLGNAIATEKYVSQFYETTPSHEKPYTFAGDTTELNTGEWDCIAAYLGTGQYWRDNSDLSTSQYYATLQWAQTTDQTYTIDGMTLPVAYQDMKYGLSLYVEAAGYTLDPLLTRTEEVDVNGGTFTFNDYMAEIDAGRVVLISITEHSMLGYGYNAETREIIFDDTYDNDQRMTWGGTYDYAEAYRELESITVIAFDTSTLSSGSGGSGADNAVLVYSSGTLTSSGAVISGAVLTFGGNDSMYVSSGGTANDTTINYGGSMSVFSGGGAKNTVNDGGWFVCDGTANNTTIKDGAMFVSGGGIADSTTVNSRGRMRILSGGTATNIIVSGGGMEITVALNTYVQGTSNGSRFEMKDASLSGYTINDRDVVFVHSGGTAADTTVNSKGSMYIDSGGTANDTTINSGGRLFISSGGTASIVFNPWQGDIYSSTGASVTLLERDANVYYGGESAGLIAKANSLNALEVASGNSALVYSGGVCNSTVVASKGRVVVSNGGSAIATMVNSHGKILISSGGTASRTILRDGGMYLSSGGVAENTEITSGGYAYLDSGSIHRGYLHIASDGSGTFVSAYAGTNIDFTVAARTTSDTALINSWALISGGADANCTITVNPDQAPGTYKLADEAANFANTITVKTTDDTTLGTLSVGGSFASGEYTYSLTLNSGTLAFEVDSAAVVSAKGDFDVNGYSDVLMTISDTGHLHYGATGAWLISSGTPVWDSLSTLSGNWKPFGTGSTAAGKPYSNVYLYDNVNHTVGAWLVGEGGKVTGWETVADFDTNTNVLGLGDFNSDGKTDLLLQNNNGMVGSYLTDGTGWHEFAGLGSEWTVSTVGDFNADGIDDVVLRHDAGFAGTWLVGADGSLTWGNLDTLTDDMKIVGSGDFNGDGTDDILLQNGNYVGAWLVKNGSVKSFMGLGTMSDGNVVETIGDYNGDGIDDLRIRTSNGDLGALCVKGADQLEWKYFGSVGSEWSTALAAI